MHRSTWNENDQYERLQGQKGQKVIKKQQNIFNGSTF